MPPGRDVAIVAMLSVAAVVGGFVAAFLFYIPPLPIALAALAGYGAAWSNALSSLPRLRAVQLTTTTLGVAATIWLAQDPDPNFGNVFTYVGMFNVIVAVGASQWGHLMRTTAS